MASKAEIQRGVRHALCIGCGLCANHSPEVRMVRCPDGFLRPSYIPSGSGKWCPARRLEAPPSHGLWGCIKESYIAWSLREDVRWKASSGGSVTALCLYLLESGKVSGVLQVGGAAFDNSLRLSRTADDVLSCCGSRYAPAPVFEQLNELLDNSSGPLAFVGKPCDVSALQNYLRYRPGYASRIAVTIAIFCAGIPSFTASERAARACSSRDELPVALKYRGEGWPGTFRAQYQDGTIGELDYEQSWGEVLGRDLPLRCKICPDGVGLCADVAASDAWYLKDGKPSFEEAQGRNCLMCRTDAGVQLVGEAAAAGYLHIEQVSEEATGLMQPYQKMRREVSRARILPLRILAPFRLHFHGCFCRHKAGLHVALHEFIGSAKRCLKVLVG